MLKWRTKQEQSHPILPAWAIPCKEAIDEAICQRKDDMLTVSDEKVNVSSIKSNNPGKGQQKQETDNLIREISQQNQYNKQ